MASLQILKKHLGSIRMTGQLAGAMKTVSAAKLNKLNSALQSFSAYHDICQRITAAFGSALDGVYSCKNPAAPVCYVILGSNRGLCGGYNMELYGFVKRVLEENHSAGRQALCLVTGKHAVSHYQDSADAMTVERSWLLPDVIRFEDGEELFSCALQLYTEGRVSAVVVLYQHFVNMLTQTPAQAVLLPMSTAEGEAKRDKAAAPLYVPDRETVLAQAAHTCLRASLHMLLLESAAGHQAATLVAMRSAYDNAEKSAAALEAQISRQRQSQVTSSVIETAGGNLENPF